MKLNGSQPLNLKGVFTIKHLRGDNVIDEMVIDNTITNSGKATVAGLLNAINSSTFRYMALDSSGTAAAAANTALASEITSPSLDRALATTSRVTGTVTNDTDQLLHTFSSTATQTVRGVGIFSTASGGIMISRATFTAKALESGDTLQVTHKITVS